jgi:hypothetical protein
MKKSTLQNLLRGIFTDEDIFHVVQQYKLFETDGVLDRKRGELSL